MADGGKDGDKGMQWQANKKKGEGGAKSSKVRLKQSLDPHMRRSISPHLLFVITL